MKIKNKKIQTKLAMTNNPTSKCQNKKEPKKSWHATIYKTPRKRQTSHALEASFSFRSVSPRTHFDSVTRASIHW